MRFPGRASLGTALLGTALVGTLMAGTVGAQAPMTVTMKAMNGSGMDGTATLTDLGSGKTKVMLDLKNGPAGPQPAHVHEGTCATLNPAPKYPLTNVVNGRSETTLDVGMSDLMKGSMAINVHKSPQDIPTYVSCGDIAAVSSAAGSGAGAPAGAGSLPKTGGPLLPIAGLAAAGLASLGLGVASRRRAR